MYIEILSCGGTDKGALVINMLGSLKFRVYPKSTHVVGYIYIYILSNYTKSCNRLEVYGSFEFVIFSFYYFFGWNDSWVLFVSIIPTDCFLFHPTGCSFLFHSCF